MVDFPDFQLIPDFFDTDQLTQINKIYQALIVEANVIMQKAAADRCSLADFYRQ